ALSGSFCAGFALVRAIPVPARPCEEASHAASRQVFLDAVAHGLVISWQHINLLGEDDFSDEKLRDSVGIRPPKLTPKEVKNLGAAEPRYVLQSPGLVENCVGLYVLLLEFNRCWSLEGQSGWDQMDRRASFQLQLGVVDYHVFLLFY